jgi:hypothetical protein
MFPQVEPELVSSLFEQHGQNAEATIGALLELTDPEASARNAAETGQLAAEGGAGMTVCDAC